MLMGRGSFLKAVAAAMRAWAHAVCALLLLGSLGSAAAGATAAQLRPQPIPATLTEVRLLSENADESRFELTFDPRASSYAPMASQQPTQPSIGFALTSRGRSAVQPPIL
jgi:general secretion pathway protein D